MLLNCRLLHEIENRVQVQLDSLIPRHRVKGDKSSASVARSRANSLMECEDADLADFDAENNIQSDDSFCLQGLEDVVRSGKECKKINRVHCFIGVCLVLVLVRWFVIDQYITVELADVPSTAVEYFAKKGYFILFALYPHENKLSVVHYSIRSTTNIVDANEENSENQKKHTGIKSKTPLLFHVRNYAYGIGFRRSHHVDMVFGVFYRMDFDAFGQNLFSVKII